MCSTVTINTIMIKHTARCYRFKLRIFSIAIAAREIRFMCTYLYMNTEKNIVRKKQRWMKKYLIKSQRMLSLSSLLE